MQFLYLYRKVYACNPCINEGVENEFDLLCNGVTIYPSCGMKYGLCSLFLI